jgi:hypothetical protein
LDAGCYHSSPRVRNASKVHYTSHDFCGPQQNLIIFAASVQNTGLSALQKSIRKRVWWCLFCRDRTLALARGRPCTIRKEDCNIEALCEGDFQEDEMAVARTRSACVPIQFFLHFVELCDNIGLILADQGLFSNMSCSLAAKKGYHERLENWYLGIPKELRWNPDNNVFWPSVLQIYY